MLPESTGDEQRSVGMSIDGQLVDLRYQVSAQQVDVRAASVPAGSVESFGDRTSLELFGTEFARGTNAEGSMSLSMHGFSAAYAILRKHCDETAQKPVAGTAPKKPVSYIDDKLMETLSPPARFGWEGPKPAAPVLPAPGKQQRAPVGGQ
jgi:hypothetical protein